MEVLPSRLDEIGDFNSDADVNEKLELANNPLELVCIDETVDIIDEVKETLRFSDDSEVADVATEGVVGANDVEDASPTETDEDINDDKGKDTKEDDFIVETGKAMVVDGDVPADDEITVCNE